MSELTNLTPAEYERMDAERRTLQQRIAEMETALAAEGGTVVNGRIQWRPLLATPPQCCTANASGEGRELCERTSPPPCSASALTSQPERPLIDRYNELLYAVARKFPGESRHETALRYIRDAEEVHAGPCVQNASGEGRPHAAGKDDGHEHKA